MTVPRVLFFCAVVLGLTACRKSSPRDLTAREVADILQIHAWRVPLPAESDQWTMDVVAAGSEPAPKHLAAGEALISLRNVHDDIYEFTLKDQHGQAAGTLKPCAEPKELPPLCDNGSSISFRDPPVCLGDCSRAIIADVTPMIGEGTKRWIVITQIKTPIVRPDENPHVEPAR